MNEPMQIKELKEYIHGSREFKDAALEFLKDPTCVNYCKLSAACESHQRVTEAACAFVREVIETQDPDLAEKHKSQLKNYIDKRIGPLPSLNKKEKEPNIDIHALNLLQEKPELFHQFERTSTLDPCLAELGHTLEEWYALYRQLALYSGYPV